MGVLGNYALEQEQGLSQLPQAEPPIRETGFVENVAAGFQASRSGPDMGSNNARYMADAHGKIAEALRTRGYDLPNYSLIAARLNRERLSRGDKPDFLAMTSVDADNALWSALKAERRKDPKFLSELGDVHDLSSLDAYVAAQRRRDMAAAEEVQRGATGWGTVGGLIGGLGGELTKPETYIPVGGGATATASIGRQILSVAAREAAANAGVTVLGEPLVRTDAARIGVDRTLGDFAGDVAMSAAAGAVLGGGAKAVEIGASRLPGTIADAREALLGRYFDSLPDSVQRRMLEAGTIDQRAEAEMIPQLLGADRLTPDERAAIHVLNYDADVRESSPFKPGPDADRLHGQRLAAAIDALKAGEPAPSFAPAKRPPLRSQTAMSSSSREIAARIIMAESGGKATAKNPMPGQSASGLGQFIDSTWLSGMKQWFPRIARGKTDEQLLALKTDPDLGRQMTERAVQEYGKILTKAGFQVTPARAYLIHFLGPKRGVNILHRPADLPIRSFLPKEVIDANPSVLTGKTVGDVRRWAASQVNDPIPVTVGDRAPGTEPSPFAPDAPEGVELRPDLIEDPATRREAEAALYGTGRFGPVIQDVSDWKSVVERLRRDGTGEAPGALFHPDTGPIDVIWGTKDGGLRHIIEKHPDVVDTLPEILAGMTVEFSGPNRVQLYSEDYKAAIRLDHDDQAKTWLLTAFRRSKKGKTPPAPQDRLGAGGGQEGYPALGDGTNIGKGRTGRKIADRGPVDLLTRIAEWGGLRNDEGHDLAVTGNLDKRMTQRGRVLRKNGLSLDQLGERMWEAGWFGPPSVVDRPSVDEVLDLVEAAGREKVYHPDDYGLAAERERMMDDGSDEIRSMIDGSAQALGIEPDAGLIDDVMARIRAGEDADQALIAAVNERFFEEASREAGDIPAKAPDQAMTPDDWERLGEMQDSLARWDDPEGQAALDQALSIEHDLMMAMEADPAGGFRIDDAGDEYSIAALLDEADREEAAITAMEACMTPGGMTE